MQAKQVYEKQQQLRRTEEDLSELSNELYWERARAHQATDYFDHPAYVKASAHVSAIKAEVESLQDAIGGVVYRIHDDNLTTLIDKVAKLQKRAARVDCSIEFQQVETEVEIHKTNFGRTQVATTWHYCTLRADRIKLADWVLLAKLSIEEAGVLVGRVPAFSRAWALYREGRTIESPDERRSDDAATQVAQAQIDAIDLTRYQDPATAAHCEYCGKNRKRTATYVVEHLGTHELKQVGSNCLRDFLGIDPHVTLRLAELLRDLDVSLSEGGHGTGTSDLVEDFLLHACTVIRENGWSKADSDHPTKGQASDNLYYWRNSKHDKQGLPLWVEPTDEDREHSAAALAWARDELEAVTEFDHNLKVAASATVLTHRIAGTLAYLPVAYSRHIEKEIEHREEKTASAQSEYQGEIGKPIELTARVFKVFECESTFGATYITILRDEAGNAYKWFGSYELERDHVYTGRWSVKAHELYKEQKQTVITRPRNLDEVLDQ